MNFSIFDWKKSELGFVVCVLAVLFTVSLFQLRIGEMKTRDAQRRADAELVARALFNYYEDYGFYPSAIDGMVAGCGKDLIEACNWGQDSLTDEENITYINRLPNDPLYEQGRNYIYESDGKDRFRIYVGLERSSDPSFKNDLTIGCGINVQCSWYVGSH